MGGNVMIYSSGPNFRSTVRDPWTELKLIIFVLFLVKISSHIIYSFSGQNTFENKIISEEILKGVYFNKLWQILKAWYGTAFDKKVYNYIVAI